MRTISLACVAMFAAAASAQSPSPSDADADLAQTILSLTDRTGGEVRLSSMPDGGLDFDLGGGFQHVHVSRINEDGQLRTACVGSLAEANLFFGRNLQTGEILPAQPSVPDVVHDMTGLQGMTPEEYAFYWSLIEQAEAEAPKAVASSMFNIINADGPGEGLNDPTAAAPEGGNAGATRGQQRLNVMNHAAGIWAAFLDSTVAINVETKFDPLTCTSEGATLGSAGPTSVHGNFANAPLASTWYIGALANKIVGADLSANHEVVATFNSSIDTGCLGAGTRFYYGLDNTTPAGRVNLLMVALHEIGHGLGFVNLTDTATGAYLSGFPDVWAHFLFDRSLNLTWVQMTQGQRAASAVNANNVLWNGQNVRIASSFLTVAREASTGRVELYTPAVLEAGSSVSHFNSTASPNLLMEPQINTGLPLTLDLTRQLMRDIGWFRDANGDGVADTVGNVQPSGGSVVPGSNVNITWANVAGFSRNVTIELSTDGGTTFPTTIAANITNTGTRAWTVPNTPTSQARIRVREHDFAAPAGVSAANFSISTNTPPTFNPASAQARQQGSAAGAAVAVGTVSDAQTAAGSLVVTQIAGGTATGITVGSIGNSSGAISATVAASCTATSGTVRFQVSDGSLTGTGDLQVNVSANTLPTLSYANALVVGGGNGIVAPASGPSDNGSIASIVVLNPGTFTGTLSVNSTSGVVSFSNAAPVGVHAVTIRATDNCGAQRDATLQFTVTNSEPSFIPAAAQARQQGSPAGAAVVIGTASDLQTAAGSLVVTQIAGGTATGITAGSISNSNGTISATLGASCTATSGTVRFQVSDGSLTGTGDLQVNVSANTLPTLSYANAAAVGGANGSVAPASGPSDNGSVASIALLSPGTFTGTLAVNNTTGMVTFANAAPVGVHTVTIRATDNCGAQRDATLQFTVSNSPPTFTAAAAQVRQQGSPAGAAVAIGTASDLQTAAGSLVVTQIAGGTATGITAGSISNSSGAISATLAASCSATSGTVRFQVSDGSLTGTGDLQVNVDGNTQPTLSYAGAGVVAGGATTISPSSGPSDNGSVASIAVLSAGTFSGTLSVNGSSGVVSIANAAPIGAHTITIRATDNCGAQRDATILVSVGGTVVFNDGFEQ
jgi:hypothetical protein